MRLLVCGGAGYIGSHMVRWLRRHGHEVRVLDDLSHGHRQAVPAGLLQVGSVLDRADLDLALAGQGIDAVLHFAGLIQVGESVRVPLRYHRSNVVGTLTLLEAMQEHGVGRLIFSSTAAVYGQPRSETLDEDQPVAPINPYGRSKALAEQIIADACSAHGLRAACLRYFNAAGADPDGGIGEAHDPETHLIPNLLRAVLGQSGPVELYGEDYPTADGTCIRDYVHVFDLCAAHLLALDWLGQHHSGWQAFNLGNGAGYSVRQVLDAAGRITGQPVPHRWGPRRAGDSPRLVADASRARAVLGWRPQYDLDAILASAWRWHQDGRWSA